VAALNTFWIRIVTDSGIEGWGEGFGHACVAATKTVFDTQIAPAILGQDARDPAKLYPLDLDRAFKSLDKLRRHIGVWWTIRGKRAISPPRLKCQQIVPEMLVLVGGTDEAPPF
jgi:hypothetical protein